MSGKIQMSSYICFKKQKVLYGKWAAAGFIDKGSMFR